MVFCLQVRFSLITGVCVWPRTSFAATTGEDLLHLKLSSVMERSKLSALPSEQWCTSQQTFYNSKKTRWLRLAKRSAADPLFQVEAKQLSEWHVPFLTCQLSLTAEASLSESTLSSTSSWAKRQPARYTENWDGATCMFSNLFFTWNSWNVSNVSNTKHSFSGPKSWTQEFDHVPVQTSGFWTQADSCQRHTVALGNGLTKHDEAQKEISSHADLVVHQPKGMICIHLFAPRCLL
jgi:hypothetical protein